MHSPQARDYRPGDLSRVCNPSFDHFEVLGVDFEQQADGLWSIWLDGCLIGVFGYARFMPGVIGVFSNLDRLRCQGHGKTIAGMLRHFMLHWAGVEKAHRVEATCAAGDRVAAVFLRACGMRLESVMEAGAPDASDLLVFKKIVRK